MSLSQKQFADVKSTPNPEARTTTNSMTRIIPFLAKATDNKSSYIERNGNTTVIKNLTSLQRNRAVQYTSQN